MKTLAWLVAAATLLAAGAYTVISLVRWEWNRALFFGLVFVAAEIGVATAVVIRRINQLEERTHDPRDRSGEILTAVRRARLDHRRFAWTEDIGRDAMTRTNVFITMVVGGGILLSGLAWVVDKVANATADSGREAKLAKDLALIDYPDGGIVVDDVTVLARPTIRHDDPRVSLLLRRRQGS
ncbi:MAG TPA: hypothetical protein VK860_04180 [Ilumatobacteraceae bacterium]|nr:hypothetical protein [Ilumatobacteraceae bacterium]